VTATARAIVYLVIALIVAGLGYGIYHAGGNGERAKTAKTAVKTAKKETKNAQANAGIAKKTEADRASDKDKGAKALGDIEDAAKRGGSRDCLTPDGLRRFNDPLGDAAAAGGRGVPEGLPARSSGGAGGDGHGAAVEPRRLDPRPARLRPAPQRAGSAGEATPEVSIIKQRLNQFFPEEAK
jgi:hypothetical protein